MKSRERKRSAHRPAKNQAFAAIGTGGGEEIMPAAFANLQPGAEGGHGFGEIAY